MNQPDSFGKLIITVTVDSRSSYPGNPYCPEADDIEGIAEEYTRSLEAGASVCHLHGVYRLESVNGRKVPRIDSGGWQRLTDLIRSSTDAVLQFGLGSVPVEDRVELMDLRPEMMSACFTAEDLHFHPDPAFPANDFYVMRTRDDICQFAEIARDHGVKLDIESFHTGAFYNIRHVAARGLLPEPTWTTIMLGWQGGAWTPPSPLALVFMVENLPRGVTWNLSVMDPPTHWQLLAQAIGMGGHVRVGWEDNPFLEPGVYAERCHLLVEKVVRIATELGRDVASPAEARRMILGS
jgi:3-keto-5-aminohexanoate cleavage enzyme